VNVCIAEGCAEPSGADSEEKVGGSSGPQKSELDIGASVAPDESSQR
jgi:hypothetical protein